VADFPDTNLTKNEFLPLEDRFSLDSFFAESKDSGWLAEIYTMMMATCTPSRLRLLLIKSGMRYWQVQGRGKNFPGVDHNRDDLSPDAATAIDAYLVTCALEAIVQRIPGIGMIHTRRRNDLKWSNLEIWSTPSLSTQRVSARNKQATPASSS
jgi:hypothetical protein